MRSYLDLAYKVLTQGEKRMDRTGTGTLALFDEKLVFDLQDGFPAVTTKKLFIKGVWTELLWMISGKDNIQALWDQNVHIWDEWAKENGDVGPIYGVQWRRWSHQWNTGHREIDQLAKVIHDIEFNPTSRRLLVSAWNVGELEEMALPPCHYAYQFFVREGKYLDCKVQMRSVDVFLGMPFDIASYATLTHMVAHISDLLPGRLTMDFGDTHIYLNHVEQMKEQIFRKPYELTCLYVNALGREIHSIDDFKLEDLALHNYQHHPAIKGAISK